MQRVKHIFVVKICKYPFKYVGGKKEIDHKVYFCHFYVLICHKTFLTGIADQLK